MLLTPDDLRVLSEHAARAAREAGQLIAQYAGRSVKVQCKEGGDSPASQVVTEVDLLSEQIIINTLRPGCERYDLALLTEESADDRARLEKDYFWCVDPMDGTLAFTESLPGYAVAIALVSRTGVPMIGVVYDPVTHTLYTAVQGLGAFRNGEPWSLAPVSGSGQVLTLVCDRGFTAASYYPQLHEALVQIAEKSGYCGLQVRERNGAVMNTCWVLENRPAVYFKCPKPGQGGGSLWDFAASAALFNETGGFATDIYGQPLDLNRTDSTFMNHRGVLFSTSQSVAQEIQQLWPLESIKA